jgi:hypothetical protein
MAGVTQESKSRRPLERLHAAAGPTPIRNSIKRKKGIVTALKNGAPIVCFTPVIASDMTGNMTPQRTEKQMLRKTRLLKRKNASRDSKLSSERSDRKRALR